MATISPPLAPDNVATMLRAERQWQIVLRRFRRHRMAMVGVAVLALMFGASLLAPLIAPYPRDAISLEGPFLPPLSASPQGGGIHLLGTDHLGRDYVTRLLYAARVSLMVAVTVQTIAVLIGIILGLLALAGVVVGVAVTMRLRG